ncbi:universal stress protein [Leptolyngbya sp. AN02str]|uniref:universal stress protein n=1 Tax=Leptolyngbya sp. AN02str TaxID=3423363 RepID=UPI003D31BE70
MTYKILAAIDTSPMSRWVINAAVSLAKQVHGHIGVLYVLDFDEFEEPPIEHVSMLEPYPTPPGSPFQCYLGHLNSEHLSAMDNPELHALRTYTHDAIAQGVSAEFFQCIGEPGPTICEFAKLWEAEMIVLGHRGRSGLVELLLGSVSNHVAHYAPRSVHIVRPSLQTNSTQPQSIEAVLHSR